MHTILEAVEKKRSHVCEKNFCEFYNFILLQSDTSITNISV